MICCIYEDGILEICPENELEGYALRKWYEENKDIIPVKEAIEKIVIKTIADTEIPQ